MKHVLQLSHTLFVFIAISVQFVRTLFASRKLFKTHSRGISLIKR